MTDWDFPYEASDEASESELLDRSLSVWKGWNPFKQEEDFAPIPLDLHTAASIGQYDCVRYLIQRGEVDLDRKNKGGWTALMYCCYIGHDNIVNLLLDARVSINVRNNKGQTPLTLAASCGNESVAYFLLQAGAELEGRDKKGWTALFHATYSGHQNMVRFLLENGADMDSREPAQGYTPFLEAAASGHEIIVQCFLQNGINVNSKAKNGHTARSLALMFGHMKIVSLIDNHTLGPSHPVRSEPGIHGKDDLSSSDEAYHKPRHPSPRGSRSRGRVGVSTQDGPQAFAKMIGSQNASVVKAAVVPPGGKHKSQGLVLSVESAETEEGNKLSPREVTSPINLRDQRVSPESSSASRESIEYDEDGSAFSKTGALTIKSSSSSSGGLIGALGISRQNSADSGREDVTEKSHSDPGAPSLTDVPRSKSKPFKTKMKETQSHSDTGNHFSSPEKKAESSVFDNIQLGSLTNPSDQVQPSASQLPGISQRPLEEQHLATLLSSLGLSKYYPIFEEQDVDLQVFLSLTDNDLKEIGIKLFGPRRKMTNAIARWHSHARPAKSDLEQAYADKLEAEMQELAIQLHRACEQSEQMKAQALQERELRAVTESCLMDDRQAWQEVNRLATDTRQRCGDMHATMGLMRQYQEELSRRLDYPNLTPTSAGPSPTSLVAALQEGLSLEPNHGSYQDSKVLPTQGILRRLQTSLEEILGQLTLVTINTDKLLGRQVDFS